MASAAGLGSTLTDHPGVDHVYNLNNPFSLIALNTQSYVIINIDIIKLTMSCT